VDYYNLYERNAKTAQILLDNGMYPESVYHSCLAVEMILKSKHSILFPLSPLAEKHDIIGLYIEIANQYKPDARVYSIIKSMRKYFNESRYPTYGVGTYTESFAREFIHHIKEVVLYIENECQTTMKDLANRYKKK